MGGKNKTQARQPREHGVRVGSGRKNKNNE